MTSRCVVVGSGFAGAGPPDGARQGLGAGRGAGLGRAQARAGGFCRVTVACEPTGHRWRVLDQLAAGRGGAGVRAAAAGRPGPGGRGLHPRQERRQRRDAHRPAGHRAALLPARAGRCGVGAAAAPGGAPRAGWSPRPTAACQQIRDLLECAWPAVLDAAGKPLESESWLAAMAVVLDRCAGHRRAGSARLGLDAVRRGGPRASCPAGARIAAPADRSGACSPPWPTRPGSSTSAPARWNGPAWRWPTGGPPRARLAEVEARMVEVLDELGLTELVTSIPGLSAVGPRRSWPRPATRPGSPAPGRWSSTPGCARATTPAAPPGQDPIPRRGRPRLRLAAWRAVWARAAEQPGDGRPVPAT